MAISKTYTFTNGTITDPDEVNENFDDTLDEIKGSHHRDADGSLLEPADVHDDWGLVPKGGVILWSGSIATVPDNYSFCNGSNGTNDMRNKFIVCPGQDSGGTYDTGDTGGSATINISHTHTGPSHTHTGGSHTHTSPTHYHRTAIGFDGTKIFGWDGGSGYPNYGSDVTGTVQGFSLSHGGMASRALRLLRTENKAPGSTGAGGTGNTGYQGTGNTSAGGTGNTGASGTAATGSGGSATQNVLNPFAAFNLIIKT